jgi:2,3-bisphosphoglycerate-independent phosphoglycerate mutase
MKTSPTVLLVLDGWGHTDVTSDNAIASADTSHFDHYWKTYPHTLLAASGLAVGLPDGQVGNSEIGHMTIGAGRVLDTDLVRIGKAFDENGFTDISAFLDLFDHIKENNSVLHIMGLLGDGGVHSHQDHLVAFLLLAKRHNIATIMIHAFTDGRDTSPTSSVGFLNNLENDLVTIGVGRIATLTGRFYSMDRDNNWERLNQAESALFQCIGNHCTIKPSEYMQLQHESGVFDEHSEPIIVLDDSGNTPAPICENDGVLFLNFRSDRARMLTSKLLERKSHMNLHIVTMTQYNADFDVAVAFPPIVLDTVLAAEIADAGMTQSHIAETEKFPHATYFLNGGRTEKHKNEEHILLESRKDVPTHDMAPLMRAESIADEAIKSIESGTDFLFINIANPDMVGHSANVPAIITAIEETDRQMHRIVSATLAAGGVAIITADHGNAETNTDDNGGPHTSHTLNLVPCIITLDGAVLRDGGSLADLAPTVLDLLGNKKPHSMSGASLIV